MHTSIYLHCLYINKYLILRYWIIPDYIQHPMICLRRYSNCGLANGFFMMSDCCSFFSIKNIFDVPRLICYLKGFLFILNDYMCWSWKWWFRKYFPNISCSQILYLFSHCFHGILTIISFHWFSQMGIIFLRILCCKNVWVRKVNGSVIRIEIYHIHVVHGCFKDWYIWQFIFDGFYWT